MVILDFVPTVLRVFGARIKQRPPVLYFVMKDMTPYHIQHFVCDCGIVLTDVIVVYAHNPIFADHLSVSL